MALIRFRQSSRRSSDSSEMAVGLRLFQLLVNSPPAREPASGEQAQHEFKDFLLSEDIPKISTLGSPVLHAFEAR